MTDPELEPTELVEAEQQLERLLVRTAEDGVPELVLVALLREYADMVEAEGYVPRTWRESTPIEKQS